MQNTYLYELKRSDLMMARKVVYALISFWLLATTLQSCKASKGCGCRTNMNHYNPKKGR